MLSHKTPTIAVTMVAMIRGRHSLEEEVEESDTMKENKRIKSVTGKKPTTGLRSPLDHLFFYTTLRSLSTTGHTHP